MKNVTPELATALIGYKDHLIGDFEHFIKRISVDCDNKMGVEFEIGSKYVKIVSISAGGSRSAHSFVEISSGNILKAASWKSPARNFSRGNVYNVTTYANRATWTGVA